MRTLKVENMDWYGFVAYYAAWKNWHFKRNHAEMSEILQSQAFGVTTAPLEALELDGLDGLDGVPWRGNGFGSWENSRT